MKRALAKYLLARKAEWYNSTSTSSSSAASSAVMKSKFLATARTQALTQESLQDVDIDIDMEEAELEKCSPTPSKV